MTRGDGLTENQVKILKYLRGFRGRNGFYATVRDVQKYMGWDSPSTAYEVLLALERKGRVAKKQLTRGHVAYVPVEE